MNEIMKMIISFLVVAGGGSLVVKAEDLTIKSIERSEVEERVKVENEVIHFDDYDEYATYTLTLENPTSTKLQVTNINLTNNECVSINTDELESTIVEPNSTKEVTLTLTSNKCNVNQDNTALLSFKSKEYTEDKQEEKEDIVSPNTYGNISIFLVILFLLTAIYISLYIYSKKKPFKYLKLSTIIYLSLLIITTITYTIMTSYSANEESLTVGLPYIYRPRRVLMKRNINEEESYWEDVLCEDEGTFWENYYAIKSIYIRNKIEEPSTYEKKYDASMDQDGSILVYKVVNQDYSGYYDLYMMADGEIFTNVDSSWLFGGFANLSNFNGLENLNTVGTENMKGMFSGYSSSAALNLSNLDTSKVTDMSDMFNSYNSNTPLDLSNFNTSNVINMSNMFSGYSSSAALDLSHFDTSNVTDMSGMFSGYSPSAPLDLSNFDTSNVTDMSRMFSSYSSSAMLDLSHLDTSNVTNMSWMFSNYSSSAPLDLSHLDTSKVTNMRSMFSGYSSNAVLDLSHFDTSKVTDMSFMFSNYNSNHLLDLSHFDTSNVTDMSGMFSGYSPSAPLDLSNFDTSNVTDMSRMFSSYSSNSPLDLSSFDTSKVTDMSRMFYEYSSSSALDLQSFDTSNVTNMSGMFGRYSSGQPLDLSIFDTSKVTDMSMMFSEYSSGQPLDLSDFVYTNVTNMRYMFDSWNSFAELDISSMTFETLPVGIFKNKVKVSKVYVANDSIKNMLLNGGFPLSSFTVIVGSCEDGVCHSN